MTTDNFTFSMADDWESPPTAQQILERHLASGNKEMSAADLVKYLRAMRDEQNMSRQSRMIQAQLNPIRNLRRK